MSDATPLPPTVLVVDDDETTRFLLRRLLRQHWPELHVLEAENGALGLAQVAAHCQRTTAPRSLLVLLDLNMPVLTGLEFLARYQQLPAYCHQATTVVVSSTSHDPQERAQALALAADWQPKPLGAAKLEHLLRQYLPQAFSAA